MTRIPIKEEDIDILDSGHNIFYLYIKSAQKTIGFTKESCEALKQQLLDDHKKTKERDFYKEVADERKEVVEKLEQQVKQLQEEKDELQQSHDNYVKEVWNQHMDIQNIKSQLQKYKEKYGELKDE
jgi:chromosome segregation ATPase